VGRRPSAHLHFRKANCRAFVTVDAGPLEFRDRVILDFSGPARCIFFDLWKLLGTGQRSMFFAILVYDINLRGEVVFSIV
jgi:hypothetical protein